MTEDSDGEVDGWVDRGNIVHAARQPDRRSTWVCTEPTTEMDSERMILNLRSRLAIFTDFIETCREGSYKRQGNSSDSLMGLM